MPRQLLEQHELGALRVRQPRGEQGDGGLHVACGAFHTVFV
jgi:hypothetical protein